MRVEYLNVQTRLDIKSKKFKFHMNLIQADVWTWTCQKKKIQNLEFSLAWLDSLVQPNLSSNSSSISSSWSWDPTQVNYQAILSISYYQAHWIWISNSNSQLVKILIRYEFIFKLIQNLLVITTYTNGPLSLF